MLKDAATSGEMAADGDKDVSILYQRQRWYVNLNGGQGGSSIDMITRRCKSKSIMGCFNFDDSGYAAADCTKPRDFEKAGRKRMEYFAKRRAGQGGVAQVLIQLCHESDSLKSGDESSDQHGPCGGGDGPDRDADNLFRALTDHTNDGTAEASDDDQGTSELSSRE